MFSKLRKILYKQAYLLKKAIFQQKQFKIISLLVKMCLRLHIWKKVQFSNLRKILYKQAHLLKKVIFNKKIQNYSDFSKMCLRLHIWKTNSVFQTQENFV